MQIRHSIPNAVTNLPISIALIWSSTDGAPIFAVSPLSRPFDAIWPKQPWYYAKSDFRYSAVITQFTMPLHFVLHVTITLEEFLMQPEDTRYLVRVWG